MYMNRGENIINRGVYIVYGGGNIVETETLAVEIEIP